MRARSSIMGLILQYNHPLDDSGATAPGPSHEFTPGAWVSRLCDVFLDETE
jgi:hypothetical protein